MNLHEFQAKQLFRDYGIPVPEGQPAYTVQEALDAAKGLGGDSWIVKAQVHAGGRGKAGGVSRVDGLQDLERMTKKLLGSRLVTHQTTRQGQPVNIVLVEQPCHIERELYLSAVVDRGERKVAFIASVAGGMDIEEVAAKEPQKILTTFVNPVAGLQPYQCRQFAFEFGLVGEQVAALTKIMLTLYKLFTEKDASLLEINPLVVTREGGLLALDAKINIDYECNSYYV